jgi:hypothetical protein
MAAYRALVQAAPIPAEAGNRTNTPIKPGVFLGFDAIHGGVAFAHCLEEAAIAPFAAHQSRSSLAVSIHPRSASVKGGDRPEFGMLASTDPAGCKRPLPRPRCRHGKAPQADAAGAACWRW